MTDAEIAQQVKNSTEDSQSEDENITVIENPTVELHEARQALLKIQQYFKWLPSHPW